METQNLHHLTLTEEPGQYKVMLDQKEIHHVESYEIKKSSAIPGTAELSVKVLVRYP